MTIAYGFCVIIIVLSAAVSLGYSIAAQRSARGNALTAFR